MFDIKLRYDADVPAVDGRRRPEAACLRLGVLAARQLLQLAAIVECGSFSAAAERLGTSQPALTRTISIIERRTGLLLFDRSSRPPKATEAGLTLAVLKLGSLGFGRPRRHRRTGLSINLIPFSTGEG